jgi:hypothetical protein
VGYSDRKLASVFVVALLAAACSKQSANKRNFKTAIQAALDQKPVCISVGLPREVPNWNGKEQKDDQLEVLIGPGLAKKSQAMVHRSAMDFLLDDRRPKLIPGIRYDLTDEGKKYVHQSKPQVATLMGTPLQDLCYGTQEVTEIVRYSEPTAMPVGTMSEVTYKWKLRDPAKWAKDPGIQEKIFHRPSTQHRKHAG